MTAAVQVVWSSVCRQMLVEETITTIDVLLHITCLSDKGVTQSMSDKRSQQVCFASIHSALLTFYDVVQQAKYRLNSLAINKATYLYIEPFCVFKCK